MAQVRLIEATYPNEDFVWYAFSHLFSTKLYLIHINGKKVFLSVLKEQYLSILWLSCWPNCKLELRIN